MAGAAPAARTDPNRLLPVCANGYNHLMDTRYEVRDAQEVFAALADRDPTAARRPRA